ncbi:urease subunit beta [Halobacterium bonnevillei]|uniref:Urease subunit beta n=1 Tax=Halobacterium bonnevillei TaxID=2692200 RepID=A0A6B0SY24_9EURY|nr:urease subunit beta [Halobacterium bonnevillei]MXR22279.1 urease subunit beta [Halobacterium bonnevillei]
MGDGVVPGEVIPGSGSVLLNEGRECATVSVANTGDRPVQVGSHFHFFEANAALRFDREAAFGMRLDVPAGTAVRFEPGDEQTVDLVAIGGDRRVRGLNGMVEGSVDVDPGEALDRLRAAGFADTGRPADGTGSGGPTDGAGGDPGDSE